MAILGNRKHKGISKEAVFRLAMQTLWEGHNLWVRQVIISAAADLADLILAVDKLMQNQVDIGNAFKPFYGGSAGDRLAALLQEHISGIYQCLILAKAADVAKLESAKKALYENANALAAFLASANPEYWSAEPMNIHIEEHLTLILAELDARSHMKWAEDIAVCEKARSQMLEMANIFSSGIIEQFPERF